jgi:hypothetical protein
MISLFATLNTISGVLVQGGGSMVRQNTKGRPPCKGRAKTTMDRGIHQTQDGSDTCVEVEAFMRHMMDQAHQTRRMLRYRSGCTALLGE